MSEGRILYPEDKIPFQRLLPLGMQHVVAMFGATVLAPVIMGFDPQLALFFSGVGTLIFLATTALKVPSYLGSSFSFIGPVLAALVGILDPQALAAVQAAPWIGLPPFEAPRWSFHAILVIAPIFIVLVAENKGHITAISSYMQRDLNPHLGRAYLGDAMATFVSAMGGGTPQTTYAENMGSWRSRACSRRTTSSWRGASPFCWASAPSSGPSSVPSRTRCWAASR